MSVAKYAVLLGLVGFLLLASFGIGRLGMTTGVDGKMFDCPLAGVPSLCHMSPIEHAFTLQSLLNTATPFSGIFALVISILLTFTLVLLGPFFWRSLRRSNNELTPGAPLTRHRFVPRHTLQEAFARGILNSKVF